MAFKMWLVNLAHMYCGSKIDKSDFYLHHEHLNAVKSLHNNNIIISKPNKGAGVIIHDKQDYNNKMVDIIKDTTKFKILGSVQDRQRGTTDTTWITQVLQWTSNT